VRVGEVGVEVEEVVVVESNCDVRSASWERRRGSCEDIDLWGGVSDWDYSGIGLG
jgi:hypothetical protein